MLAWTPSTSSKQPGFSHSFLHKPIIKSNREIFILLLNLIDFPEDLKVSVSALSSLSTYCDSPRFVEHMDALLIDFFEEMNAAMKAFINRLSSENDIQDNFDLKDDLFSFDIEQLSTSNELSHLLRLLILEFLQTNLVKPFFNFSHFLLGYDSHFGRNRFITANCLDVLFDMFEYTVSFESGKLYILHPSFSCKFWDVLSALLDDDRLFEPVLDVLLHKRDSFFVNHLLFLTTSLALQKTLIVPLKQLLRTGTLLLFRCSFAKYSVLSTQELLSALITSLYAIFRMYRCGEAIDDLHKDLFNLLFFLFKKFDITAYPSASILELEIALLDFFIEFPAISDQNALFRLLFQLSTLNTSYENDQMQVALQGKIRACLDHSVGRPTEEFRNYVHRRLPSSLAPHPALQRDMVVFPATSNNSTLGMISTFCAACKHFCPISCRPPRSQYHSVRQIRSFLIRNHASRSDPVQQSFKRALVPHPVISCFWQLPFRMPSSRLSPRNSSK